MQREFKKELSVQQNFFRKMITERLHKQTLESTTMRGKASSFSQSVNAHQPANAFNSQHWLTPSPHTVHVSEPILLVFYKVPFAKCFCCCCCFFSLHIKTVRQADSKTANCRMWLQRRRSGMKRFLRVGSPPLPMPQAPALNWRTLLMDRHLSSEQQRCWLQGTQINPKCASAHTRRYFQSHQLTFTTFQVHN